MSPWELIVEIHPTAAAVAAAAAAAAASLHQSNGKLCQRSPWVGIPMHKGINLKLCFVESLLKQIRIIRNF